MNDNDRLKTARKMLGEFGIAVGDVADGYNCTLEQRQASGGLGNRTAIDTEKKCTQPLGLGRTSSDCTYH